MQNQPNITLRGIEMAVIEFGDAKSAENMKAMLSKVGYEEGDRLVILLGKQDEDGVRIKVASAELSAIEILGMLTCAEHELMMCCK